MLQLDVSLTRGGFELRAEAEVAAGEPLVLAGPSGAGKTTLLRIVAGLERGAAGSVRCGEERWLDSGARISVPPEDRRCGYLFQHYALFPHLSVLDNVAYGIRAPRAERRRRALELLERFEVEPLASRRPGECSGGERQRVALARALATRPRALLLDEPLAALDSRTQARAARVVLQVLRESDAPALLVTHDFAEAALLGRRVAILDGGRVVQQGPPAELAAAPASAFVADFTGAVVLEGVARRTGEGLTVVDLDGGGSVTSVDEVEGPVAVTVHPWEVALEPAERAGAGSTQNRLPGTVLSVTPVGSRVRVAMSTPQPLTAEVTEVAVRELGVRVGGRAVASFKATATRLVPR